MAIDPKPYKPLLQHLVPLNALSGEQLDQIINSITIGATKNGELLFREGDNDRRHIFLLKGKVSLQTANREMDVIKSDSQQARFALSHQLPRKFSGKAVGDVIYGSIDSDLLHDLVIRSTHAQTNNDEDANLDWMTLVLRARVLQQVPPANIQHVLRRMEEFPVQKGDIVIREGDEADYFYVIVRGTGIVIRKDPGGDRQLAVLAQGDAFGEDALVSGGVRAASIVMASNGTLMRLAKDHFLELIRKPLVVTLKKDKVNKLIKEQNAVWLDIRNAEEFAAWHKPKAVNLPLENLRERYGIYPKTNKYVVYGPPGNSAIATFLLKERGFDVVMLDGWVPEEALDTDSGLSSSAFSPQKPEDLKTEDNKTAVSAQQPLSAATQQLTEQLQQAQQSIQDLERQLANHRKVVIKQVSEIRQLNQKIDTLTAENKRLEQSLSSANEGQNYEKAAEPLKQRIKELEQELDGLRKELDEVQDILQEATGRESTMNWAFQDTIKKLSVAEQELSEERELCRLLREENDQLSNQLHAAKSDSLGR